MSLYDAMADACARVGIAVPTRTIPDQFVRTPADGKRKTNQSGSVIVFREMTGGIAFNWITGERQPFFAEDRHEEMSIAAKRARDIGRAREKREREDRAKAVAKICERIVKAAEPGPHEYFRRKGFPDEVGLVHTDVASVLPDDALGEMIRRALPASDEPLLIVPGRVGSRLVTVQFIAADGQKKNVLGGQMRGASHRIATGRKTWVCEGIATALSVRAALRLLGRSATVLAAFSAANVAQVAREIDGAIIAADNDAPLEQLGNVGTGAFYARASNRRWIMPPERGDWNDMHQARGLRAVALALREI